VEVEKIALLSSFSTTMGPKSCYKQFKLYFADRGSKMAVPARSTWQDLCQAASTEEDSEKLLQLVSEIDSILVRDEKKPSATVSTPGVKTIGT